VRLWYQNLSNTDRRPDYRKALTDYINGIADPGTVVDCYGTPAAAGGIEYGSIRYLDVGAILASAITAERKGYDAFIIGNIMDPALQEVREMVDIPVIGHLQTSLLLMSTMAKNFAIIADHAKLASHWENLVAGYGFKDRLVSVASVDMLSVLSLEGHGLSDARAEAIVAAGRKAVAAGAEMLLVLPGSLYLNLSKKGIKEIDGAPIYNSIPGVIKMAELMVKYRQITGTFISRKHTYASPSREIVDQLVERHKLAV
jgi:Asp/Glu/hydantoin racemase